MSRPVYVYRLRVEVPPESVDDPDWYPESPSFEIERWYDHEQDTGARVLRRFRWPQRRLYLSGGAARSQARRLREWGATVEVERSEAVEWPA